MQYTTLAKEKKKEKNLVEKWQHLKNRDNEDGILHISHANQTSEIESF